MIRRLFFYRDVLILLMISPTAFALNPPGAVNPQSWSATAMQISGIQATNSSVSNSANPSGTVYYFAASTQTPTGQQIPNQGLSSNGQGGTVVSNVSITYQPSGQTPESSDVVHKDNLGALMHLTTYYVYAQACPASNDPDIAPGPNGTGCSAWTLINAQPVKTADFQDPAFAPIVNADINPLYNGATIYANPQPVQDAGYILDWHVELVNKTTTQVLLPRLLTGSYNQQWVGDLNTDTLYTLMEWFDYPYHQRSSSNTFTFATKPARPDFRGEGVHGQVISNLVHVDSTTSMTMSFKNSVDPNGPNRKGTVYSVLVRSVSPPPTDVDHFQLVTSVLGVSDERFELTLNSLWPGTTYIAYVVPENSYAGWGYPAYSSPSPSEFVTLGSTNGTPGFSPYFQPVLLGDVGYKSFVFRLQSSASIPPGTQWVVSLSNDTRNLPMAQPLQFSVPASSQIAITPDLWDGVWPDNVYTLQEWLEGPTVSKADSLYTYRFNNAPAPMGIPANPFPIIGTRSVTANILNTSDAPFNNPAPIYYAIRIYDPAGKQLETFPYRHIVNSTYAVAGALIPLSSEVPLNPSTTYDAKITAYSQYYWSPLMNSAETISYGLWPLSTTVDLSTFTTLPEGRLVRVDPASVTPHSANALLIDSLDSFVAVHYQVTLNGISQGDSQWTSGAQSMSYSLSHLSPNRLYEMGAQVCTSQDFSACNWLVAADFTSQPLDPVLVSSQTAQTSIQLSWTDNNPANTSYKVRWCTGPQYQLCQETRTPTYPSGQKSYTLGSLQAETYYTVFLQALNQGGAPWPDGNLAPLGIFRTLPSRDLLITDVSAGGLKLDGDNVCVLPLSSLEVTFNRDVDPSTLSPGIIIEKEAYAYNGHPTPLSNWTWQYDPHDPTNQHKILVVPPPGGWTRNRPTRITFTTRIQDQYPQSLSSPYVLTVVGAGETATDQRISSFVDAQAAALLELPAQTLDANSGLALRTIFIQPPDALAVNINNGQGSDLLQALRGTLVEVVRVDSLTSQATSSLIPFGNGSVRLHLPRPSGNSAQNSNNLQSLGVVMVWLNPQTQHYEIVPNVSDDGQGNLQATIQQPGVYALAQNFQSTDISGAYAYPVPYKSTMNIPGITFTGLGAGSHVRMYTPSGLRVQDIDIPLGQSTYIWDLKNSSGDKVASGIYLYLIESPSAKKTGKLIIIQ